MRYETMHNKLFDLLGMADKKIEVDPKGRAVSKNKNAPVGITEDEMGSYREAQALTYFLQAPELFTLKICPHCRGEFLVSRQFVAYCSYTCIYKSLQEKGIEWSIKTPTGFDIDENFIKEKFEGNEPLWIRSEALDAIRKILDVGPERSLLAEATVGGVQS